MASAHDSSATAMSVPGRQILGHPIGLYVLFLAQMWERFSYFGMLALLILYLNSIQAAARRGVHYFKCTPASSTSRPCRRLLGRSLLGQQAGCCPGAAFMALGHFLMVFPSLAILYGRAGVACCRSAYSAAVDHASWAALSAK